jgi:MFS family permease
MRFKASFWNFVIGQSLASLADVFFIVAVIVFVQEYTQSAFITGLIPIIRVTALLISGMLAPLVMDRLALRTVLMASQAGEALFLFLIAALFGIFMTGHGLVLLFVFMFGLGFFRGWWAPAHSAMVPRLVSPEGLVKANGLLSTTDQTVQMAGWAVGGIVVAFLGWQNTFWLSLVIMLISTLSLWWVKDDTVVEKGDDEKVSSWESMKTGWSTIWRTPTLRIVTMMDVIEGIANGVWAGAISLVYVNEVLHKGADWFGFINASYFVGTITGGLLVMALSKWVEPRLIVSMIAGSLIFSLMTFGYALTSLPAVALILCALMGPAYQLRDIAQRTIFQKNVAVSELPKVFAAQGTIIAVTFGVSVLVMGLIADLFGVRISYLTSAGLFAVSGLMALAFARKMNLKNLA